MMIIDSHLDLSWNALNWKRDLTKSIAEIRRSEEGTKDRRRGHNTVSFPEMQKAGVAVCLATVLARCGQLKDPLLDYPSREIASAMGVGQVEYYRIMESQGHMRMLRDLPALEAHMAEWNSAGGSADHCASRVPGGAARVGCPHWVDSAPNRCAIITLSVP